MDTSILTRIQSDVQNNQVMLYMKGTPVFPQCGFSAAVVAVLNNLGVDYQDRKSTRLNSSHSQQSRMPSSA